ncbi:MAG: hypothetical protein LBF58_02650 [Deltaproteobacteria bacterium]|nr:hypothetical protein [Deltaproteobacteria bacterium]
MKNVIILTFIVALISPFLPNQAMADSPRFRASQSKAHGQKHLTKRERSPKTGLRKSQTQRTQAPKNRPMGSWGHGKAGSKGSVKRTHVGQGPVNRGLNQLLGGRDDRHARPRRFKENGYHRPGRGPTGRSADGQSVERQSIGRQVAERQVLETLTRQVTYVPAQAGETGPDLIMVILPSLIQGLSEGLAASFHFGGDISIY